MPARGKPSRRVQSEPTNERWWQFLHGEITLEDMDDEELARGTFRAKDGTFRGRPPNTVPRTFAQQLSRELMRRADSRFKERLLAAIDIQWTIAQYGERESDRLKASQHIIERIIGKVPDRVVVSEGEPDWWSEVDSFLDGLEGEQMERARVVLGRSRGANESHADSNGARPTRNGRGRRDPR